MSSSGSSVSDRKFGNKISKTPIVIGKTIDAYTVLAPNSRPIRRKPMSRRTAFKTNEITEIGSGTFQKCTGLSELHLPRALKTIGKYAFSDCSALTEIALPAGLTHIEFRAFHQCDKLTSVTFGGTDTAWNAVTIGEDNAPIVNATKIFAATAE